MKKVRRGIFETNSSSTHSISICDENEYDKWVAGTVYYYENDNEFVDEDERKRIIKKDIIHNRAKLIWEKNRYLYKYKDEINSKIDYFYTEDNIKEITEDQVIEYLENNDNNNSLPMSYDEYWDYYASNFETYTEKYISENGDKIVAFGYYGYDG